MLSITPQIENSELNDLKYRLKIIEEQLESRKIRARIILWISWIPILVLIIRGFGFERWSIWGGLTLLYLIVAPASFLLIQSKSKLQTWSDRLKDEIKIETDRILAEKDRVLAETETLAIEQISILREEINSRRLEMLAIEEEIKYKRKWRWEFDDFPETLEVNARLDSLALDKMRGFVREVERLREDRYGMLYKYNYKLLPIDISTRKYHNYQWLRWRLDRMQAWQTPDRILVDRTTEEDDVYDEIEEAADKERFKEDAVDNDFYDEPLERSVLSNPPSPTQQVHQTERTFPNEQASLFDELSLTPKPVTEVPHQRQRFPKYKPIKISYELRNQINNKKFQIGWLGELAVLEFEKDRLSTESNNEHREIKHTSRTNDAAGYDIQSWNGYDKIYIEVKTTVGDFWSNLYFTENEFKTMKDLGTSYCLYRICKFNVDTGEGDLFIYEGSEMIFETFEFNSKMYLLSEKLH